MRSINNIFVSYEKGADSLLVSKENKIMLQYILMKPSIEIYFKDKNAKNVFEYKNFNTIEYFLDPDSKNIFEVERLSKLIITNHALDYDYLENSNYRSRTPAEEIAESFMHPKKGNGLLLSPSDIQRIYLPLTEHLIWWIRSGNK